MTQSNAAADDRAAVVIRDITVLEPSGRGWLPHRDIIVRHTTITTIQPAAASVPAAKIVINGGGKFAIPGLFDNRVRIERMPRENAGLFVAYGVTSVRDSAGDSPRVLEWRRDISYGKLIGPRLLESAAAAPAVSLPQSNAGSAAVTPGLTLHDELVRLVSRGMTPADALRAATIESARSHGRGHDLGSIEAGKIADLLVLNDDPLADINHTRSIDAVIFRGEALTRAHLNLLLSKSQLAARR